jgi:hypothetical protein
MTQEIYSYLFNLVSNDLKESQELLINYTNDSEFYSHKFLLKSVKSTTNKINLAKKTLKQLKINKNNEKIRRIYNES